ncbi:MAG TPA: tetratricopeptide repeat protein [bacterium]|nr:tetratricopeptide repeat protein [bacterium]
MRYLVVMASIIGILCFIGCVPPGGVKPAAETGTDPMIDECFNLTSANRFADAIPVCRAAVGANPGSFIAHASLARALWETGNFEESEQYYRLALEINPEAIQTRMELASALKSMNDAGGAIAEYQMILSVQPDYIAAVIEMAQTYESMGTLDSAADAYQRAIGLQPDNDALYLDLAGVQRKARQMKAARETLADAAQRFPNAPRVIYSYAALLQDVKRYPEAVRQYEAVIALAGDYQNARYNIAVCHYSSGNYAAAEKALTVFLNETPGSSSAHMLLGQIAYDRNNYTAAEREFRRAIQYDPDNGNAWVLLGNVLRSQGDKDGAKEAYRQALRINPRDSVAKKNLKRLY